MTLGINDPQPSSSSQRPLMIEQRTPSWLQEWLNIPFYEDHKKCKCSKHTCKYLTVFCGRCRENPICEICWKNEGFKHGSDHPIVQVCIASHRAAVEKDAMSRFMDTSHIQKYKINNKNVVYLKPNEKADRQVDGSTIPKCETCHRKLKDIHYGYCSISCKVGMMSSRSSHEWHHQIAENTLITVTKSTAGKRKQQHIAAALQAISLDQQTQQTKRKRRRKGIPRRSPST